jgi:hypothetical protein
MENKHKVEKILDSVRIRNLSQEEKEGMWHGVVSKIAEMPAPQAWSLNKSIKKPMLSIFAVIAVLVLGVSGTVVASNGAKPGDTLFGIDRAVEDIRINMAGDDKKDDLRIAFAEERVQELEDIIKTEDDGSKDDNGDRSKRVALGIESATSFLESVSAQIALSDDKDKAARIEALIKQLSDELGGLSGEISLELQNEDQLQVRFQENNSGSGKSEDNGNSRVEIKSDDGKLKIEMKDGELRIKNTLFDDNSDDSDDDSNSTSSDDNRNGFDAEADVFTDKTVVKVEMNDTKTTFTTSSKIKDAVIADILAKFPSLSKAQVEAGLNFQIENQASESDDISNSTSSDNGSDDDSDNDSSNDDSSDDDSSDDDSNDDNGGSDDDDSNDDNSGSGSGNSGSGNGGGSDD